MDDDALKRILDQMSYDTRQLLEWEAQRLSRLRREAGIEVDGYDLDASLCSGHQHDGDA